jgi:hypothetical protein
VWIEQLEFDGELASGSLASGGNLAVGRNLAVVIHRCNVAGRASGGPSGRSDRI